MSTQVILTGIKGALKGQEFTFTDTAQCILGRSSACDLQVPSEDFTVSRRHCLLDIDGPAVTVQDLGSLNGTFLNEVQIGRRDKRLDATEAAVVPQPRCRLWDGDELRVGDIVFRVQIVPEPAEEEFREKVESDCLICI
ncbi:MAG TPA: FHA domain-containing protein [Gemmataceae bacterium]|jgi:pSer/pThr/pTyr-binding forkhead associated (FHA) protein